MQVSVGAGPVRWYGVGALLWWLAGWALVGSVRLIYSAACHPRTSGALLAASGATWAVVVHPIVSALAVAVAAGAGLLWGAIDGPSCRRWLLLPALARWRSVWVYRRLWADAMRAAELELRDPDGAVRRPRLGWVRCTDTTDVVRVRGLLGQRFPEWEDAGPMLAHVFGAADFRLHRGDDRRLTLELLRARRGRSWNRGALELDDTPHP